MTVMILGLFLISHAQASPCRTVLQMHGSSPTFGLVRATVRQCSSDPEKEMIWEIEQGPHPLRAVRLKGDAREKYESVLSKLEKELEGLNKKTTPACLHPVEIKILNVVSKACENHPSAHTYLAIESLINELFQFKS